MARKIFIEQLPNFFETDPGLARRFEEAGFEVAFCLSGAPAQEIDAAIAGCEGCILCIEKIDARRMDLAPGLRIIATCGAGTDHIDLAAATKRGIPVCNVAGGNAVSVAEMTFAHMLGLARRVQLADRGMRQGAWRNYVGNELFGKTWGILGTGMIGEQVARIARGGFQMQVLGYDVVHRPELCEKYGLAYVSMEEIFERADFISVHLPLLPATRGSVNMDLFKRMKPTAFLVNVSRGPVINEKDLYEALENKLFAGAGMDVYENEPTPSPRFNEFDDMINTTHMAGNTVDSILRLGKSVTANLMAVLNGGEPINHVVNPGYKVDKDRERQA